MLQSTVEYKCQEIGKQALPVMPNDMIKLLCSRITVVI